MTAPLIWLLGLHIAGLAVWCASLLYLPALILGGRRRTPDAPFEYSPGALNRLVFTSIATPAALFAIVTGSALFLLDRNLGLWLILKLTAVSGLVVCHTLYGLLILRQAQRSERSLGWLCGLLAAATVTLILAILWLVLAKPS